ncbi:sensor histidine kinase [Nitratireductor kimnyeongensis]|uniref:histidine kinase n=1 Tax=Nitratireductor kimnyeongensis TaxID=430679 RepID=A0ABW0T3T6_9HYPH|nr:HAMP domain-containing sensor histidine kinase [Nitratireductor kimnyeongensis]QZZ35150.1 HAMP domain-containing histidine kinase [Nitratireductor kimnyeongensis]
MLDLKTLLLLEVCTTALQAFAWLLVWRSWRYLYELKLIAAGFSAIALGLLLLTLRGPDPHALHIFVDNMTIKLGLVLLADGMARFLGHPGCLRVGLIILAAHMALWSLAMALAPLDLSLRIHASTVFTLAMMGLMIRILYVDRGQPSFLRWITIALLVEYIGASLLQSALIFLQPTLFAEAPILSDVNSWYFFQGHLFVVGLFICLLFMVGVRLSLDLRDRNAALAQEVTERRRLEGELSASLDQEKTAREEQRQFMHMVSHEFRTPLAAIRYATEMLGIMIQNPSDAVEKRLIGIDASVSRMTQLIDRFLSTEKQAVSGLKIEKLDLRRLTMEVQQYFDHVDLGQRLKVRPLDEAPDYWGDVEMLQTVIVNLVDNALKYSPRDQPVEVTFSRRNNLLVVKVADRGIGVPEAERSHVGRRFFRASNTRRTAGNGLGLYTCRKLIGYHRGTLDLRPRNGGGTVATIRLPMPGLATASLSNEITVEETERA